MTYFIRYYVYNEHTILLNYTWYNTRYSSTLYGSAGQWLTQKSYKKHSEFENNAVNCTIFMVWPACQPGPY